MICQIWQYTHSGCHKRNLRWIDTNGQKILARAAKLRTEYIFKHEMFHHVYQDFYLLKACKTEPSPSSSYLGTTLRVWPFLTKWPSYFTSRHRARRRALASALIGLSTTPQRARSSGMSNLYARLMLKIKLLSGMK